MKNKPKPRVETKESSYKNVTFISTIIMLVIQLALMAFGFVLYEPAIQVISAEGLQLVVALFTMAPLYITVFAVSVGLTISLLIRSLFNFKRYFWLTILEITSILFHIQLAFKILDAFKN